MELKDYVTFIKNPRLLIKKLDEDNEFLIFQYIKYAFELRQTILISEEKQRKSEFLFLFLLNKVIPSIFLKSIVTDIILERTEISKEKNEMILDKIYNFIEEEEKKRIHKKVYSADYNLAILKFVWELVKQN